MVATTHFHTFHRPGPECLISFGIIIIATVSNKASSSHELYMKTYTLTNKGIWKLLKFGKESVIMHDIVHFKVWEGAPYSYVE